MCKSAFAPFGASFSVLSGAGVPSAWYYPLIDSYWLRTLAWIVKGAVNVTAMGGESNCGPTFSISEAED